MTFSQKPPLSALIVSNSQKITAAVTEVMDKSVFSPISSASSAGEAKRLMLYTNFDVVIVNMPLPDETGCDLALSVCENGPAGVLLLVKGEDFYEITARVADEGVFTLQKPVSKQLLAQVITLAGATRERLRRLENENNKLRVKIEEIKIINRAKWALIEYLRMNETQAHRYIEKQAMDLRITRREVAENIIKTYQY